MSRNESDHDESLDDLTERDFQHALVDILRERGHGVWYLDPSGMKGGGAPDLLIITKDGKVLLRELKAEAGRVQPHQLQFLLTIANRKAITANVWFPDDIANGRVDKEVEE